MLTRPALACALLVTGCDQGWQPPGGGVAKGCLQQVGFDEPMARGLGLSTHLPWGEGETDSARRGFELQSWASLGVGTARRDLHWSAIEPEQGSFDFSGPDLLVDAVEGAGAELLGLLVYGNAWASQESDDTAYPPDDPQDYAAYAAALVQRYQGRVRRWELWNEENAGVRFWKPQEDPEAYAALALAAAQAVHAVDPEAQVALGGLFWPDLLMNTPGPEFLDAVLLAEPDLVEALDAVAFHPYRYPFTAPELADEHQDSLVQQTCALRELLSDHRASALQPWITELGWHTAPDALYEGVSEQDQAAYLVRSALLALGQGVPMNLWYTFRDGGDSDSDQEQRFGLYGYDADPLEDPQARPKPAATAMGVLASLLGEHTAIADESEALGLDEQSWAYRLSGGEGSVLAVWTLEEGAQLSAAAEGAAAVVDLWGEQQAPAVDDGAVLLEISDLPSFVLYE